MLKRVLFGLLALVVVLAGAAVAWIGPRNVIGMLRYDKRDEGSLEVGDVAPDVVLSKLDGTEVHLAEQRIGKPLVLIFGSYT